MFSRILAGCLGLTLAAASLRGSEPPELHSKQVPDWAASAVWYQIFPERFRNGDPKNDPVRASLEPPIAAAQIGASLPGRPTGTRATPGKTPSGQTFIRMACSSDDTVATSKVCSTSSIT